ncbi:PREDICTED: uncharacterized protein LOC109213713 [Nicotiana attenuata]|uniref:uncharacterized protein LOC109213713 n=1 Tax=Nicotiana attenuata TaxID=49451 RepID=UPI000904CAD8|nr:PREDICTED: uncharacterized protein LOC109213713 [Nicotiana attenuata]
MAKAYTQAEFDSLMEKVEKLDIRVKEYLELAGYEKWARLYAPVKRGWTMTSNIAESINAALVSARELPIYDLLEEVRKIFGRWNCSNREINSTNIHNAWLNEAMSTRMTVVPSTEYLHTVNDEGRHYTVCLLEKKCSCIGSKCPCILCRTRKNGIYAADEVVLPRKWKRPPGRPKKKRDKPFIELLQKKNQHSCSICGQEGHNKRTCRNAPRRN